MCFEFQQNQAQNRQEFVTLMNNIKAAAISKLCRNNGQPQELGDCDLSVEFAHFLSIFKTLQEKKTKLTKTKTWCLAIILTQMYIVSFVLRVNMQGNLITAPTEFDVTFHFVICLCSQKYNNEVEQKSFKMFFADSNLLYSRFKI